MSAWPEAIYIIKKLNTSLDAMYDLTNNGSIERIHDTNDRIAELNIKVGTAGDSTDEHPPSGIIATQLDIFQHIQDLESQLEDIQATVDGLTQNVDYVAISTQLAEFQQKLDEADKRLVIISNTAPAAQNVSQYAILLQTI